MFGDGKQEVIVPTWFSREQKRLTGHYQGQAGIKGQVPGSSVAEQQFRLGQQQGLRFRRTRLKR